MKSITKLTKKQQDDIEKYCNQGWSSRKIAKQVIGRSSAKSTINEYLRRVKQQKRTQDPERFMPTDTDVDYGPNVLLLDIETSPSVSYHWRYFKENISLDQSIEYSQLLCIGLKWLNDDGITVVQPKNFDEWFTEETECQMLGEVREFMDNADFIIGHNLKAFDDPILKTRMLKYGYTPPKPYKHIDTLKTAKYEFKFPRNSLDGIADFLGVGRKNPTDFDLWRRCVAGEEEAWNYMIDYCAQDIVVLEDIYMKMRPYDSKHPNGALFYPNGVMRCGVCQSTNIKKIEDSHAITPVSMFELYQCQDCGKWHRDRKTIKTTEQRKNILGNVTS